MTVLALIATVFKAKIVKGTLRFTRLALKTMHFSKVSFVKMLLIRVEPLTLHRISSVAMCSALCRTFYKQIMLQEKQANSPVKYGRSFTPKANSLVRI